MYSAPYVGPMSDILLEAERNMVSGKEVWGGGRGGINTLEIIIRQTGSMERRLLYPNWDSMTLLWPVAIRATSKAEPVQGSLEPALYKAEGKISWSTF